MKIEDLNDKQREKLSEFGVNTWFVMDLLEDYLNNPGSVGEDWQRLFKSLNIQPNGEPLDYALDKIKTSEPRQKSPQQYVIYPQPQEGEEAVIIRGVGERIIENMTASLSIPTAASLRTIPVKVLEENRIMINRHLKKIGKGKISFTHIIGWAIVKAIGSIPALNNAFTIIDGTPNLIKKTDVNLGLAIDLEKKDGTRSLIVPNIKKANRMNFRQFFDAYNDIVNRARNNKIELPDFRGTTITLTNPGTIGTVASQPRLMIGQGAIIATGALGYPAEYQAVTKDILTQLGISKVMNITSTYDHRVIQGAESGLFLKRMHELLIGEEDFYGQIFRDMNIPMIPVGWGMDKNPEDFVGINNIEEIEKQARAIQLINMFRVRGHLLANLDPLKHVAHYHPELDPSTYGFTVWDFDREFITAGLAGKRTATLREILDILHRTYCEKIGVEYRHISDPEEKQWLQDKMEPKRNEPDFSAKEKKHILFKLLQAENFEKFVDKKYIGHKRFSLEGSETIIPLLDYLSGLAADDEVEELVIGMAHRGRLNILANIIGKSMEAIFSEFEDITDEDSAQGSGDVKYHLGASGIYKTADGEKIKVSVSSNPSHLEFVNPVVEGIVRAKQTLAHDDRRNRIIPVLLHGDAAIAGEGIVAETLNLSQLKGYSTGGTIHVIINNQIGFTTSPVDARSTVYASDVAKMVQAPIFHVNGDDPEATLLVTQLAYEFRMKFSKDVVIDVFSYRRLGHNEADEPAFTQPVLYKAIREHPSVTSLYREKLLKEKAISEDEVKAMEEEIYKVMDTGYGKVKEGDEDSFKTDLPLALTREQVDELRKHELPEITIIDLNKVVEKITTLPESFHLHPKLKKFIDSRKEFLSKDVMVDWSFAESLAFGTLLLEGIPVRLSGQDSARGTFSQRHIVLTDMTTEEEIIPLNNIVPEIAAIEPLDSLLSEAAVLGFEFGYSIADPLTLVLWEAQFGDFANAGQVIIDNFITSSDTKWGLPSNLAMLLPHGQEGQGPEHSSARLERFLALCAESNITVCSPSTAAQYYYLLRGHGKYKKRRPLVVMTPKSLLRLPEARSPKSDFIGGSYKVVIDDDSVYKADVKRVLVTSGKFYYDLLKYRKEHNRNDIAIVRIERFYPYPTEEMKRVLNSYSNAKEVVWAQEEPYNMGALNFILLRLRRDFAEGQVLYAVSRKASASPAPGSHKIFEDTQKQIVGEAFGEFKK
jgi:2-oxoglutarate dehydrogenase E1 component